jgi:Uncharacterized protein containing a von Willebrand factor type A (vWA) domain
MTSLGERLKRLFGRTGQSIPTLSSNARRSVLRNELVDRFVYENYADDSPRFKRVCVEDAPKITIDEPPPSIDLTKATPEEFAAYQQALQAHEEKAASADPYKAWADLTRDVFASYHNDQAPELTDETIDPAVELHKRILPKLYSQEAHAKARQHTRGDPTMAALATMAAASSLRETLEGELQEQARQAQEFEERRHDAEAAQEGLDGLREQAAQHKAQGQAVPQELREQIKQQVQAKRQATQEAMGAVPAPMSSASAEAIANAAAVGAQAAQDASQMPSFGYGLGGGDVSYESPEQALSIAEQWAGNHNLKRMAELFGRLDRDMRFQRSRRVVGGQEEIVDVRFGDNLQRVVPAEWALFADPDFEDDFLARYVGGELLEFSTIGEEHAGRGPVVLVVDGSGSMGGEKNCWSRAVAMCLLHICRGEKRDFAMVEFSSGGNVESWMFKASESIPAQRLLDMCSHFFGGGTEPSLGMERATCIMNTAPEFSKADICLIGDGIAGFGVRDLELREHLRGKGVRIYAIGIGGMYGYLEEYSDHAVSVHEFELDSPSQATAMLASHLS